MGYTKQPYTVIIGGGQGGIALGARLRQLGVPTIIGAGGIERIVDIKLNKDEQAMFDKSVDAVKGLVEACKGIDPALA